MEGKNVSVIKYLDIKEVDNLKCQDLGNVNLIRFKYTVPVHYWVTQDCTVTVWYTESKILI